MCLFLWVLAGLADVTKPPLQYLQAGVSHANFFLSLQLSWGRKLHFYK